MENFLMYVLWIKLLVVMIYIFYTIKGPSIWDRLLGMNLIVAKTIMLIAVFASITGMTFLLDFAIIYTLFGFIGTIFIAMFLSKHRLGKIRKVRTPEKEKDETEIGSITPATELPQTEGGEL
ncbi:MAG: monovalent cation/H+ antiporter complex subunit F [Defluviitaleaceae bacterium]|nr:monovalent cation/H+ antiporter complex subunit F [Defluviitaleaceae bacterium]